MKDLATRLVQRKYIRLWLILGGVLIALLCFEEVVDDVFSDPLEGDHDASIFDEKIAAKMRELRSPKLTQTMTDLTALGSVSVLITLFVVLSSVLMVYRDLKGLLYLAVVGTGAGLLPEFLKNFYGRERPLVIHRLADVHDLSFPSGHSFGATAVYIALAYYTGKYARTWAHEVFFYVLGGLLIFLVGTSRIYLGVHFPTDVLGGIAGGAAWALFISAVFEASKVRSRGPQY